MSDNTNRHTADNMAEFFTRLAEAIRQGKSDAQVLKRFIVACVLNKVFLPFFRNGDGEFTQEDRKTVLGEKETPIQVPFNTKDSMQGWTESAEIYLATYEAYCDLKLTFEGEMEQDALREIKSIIKTASALAAKELGIAGSKSLEVTSVRMDAALTAEDITAKLIGLYAKDGDFTKLGAVTDLIVAAAAAARAVEEPATA